MQFEVLDIAEQLTPAVALPDATIIRPLCRRLCSLLRGRPSLKTHFVKAHGVAGLQDLLTAVRDRPYVVTWLLRVVNELVGSSGEGDEELDGFSLLESLPLVGMLPVVLSFAGPEFAAPVRMQAAAFILQLACTATGLRELLSCGGVDVLVGLMCPSPRPCFAVACRTMRRSTDAVRTAPT